MIDAMGATATEMTIDELARASGMTVRNIRSHASRGLLPSPEVRARTGYYGPEHLSRLQLIQELQANGYNLAAIKHLLSRRDASADQVLDFARALLAPFEREEREVLEPGELARRYGGEAAETLRRRGVQLGLLVALGEDRFELPSPSLMRAGEAIVALGIPLETALDVLERVGHDADEVSETFVRLFMEHVWEPFARAGRPADDWPAVRETLDRLRPMATEVLVAVFHRRMTQATERAFGREL
jgi:DNA-binding transcriptional MerR regulator